MEEICDLLKELVLAILTLLQESVHLVQTNVTRYLIKNNISADEIPFWKWFSWEFIKQLGLKGFVSILVIAGFTLITFPMGIWIGSFSVGVSIPVMCIVGGIIGLVVTPLKFYTLSRTVHEITFNHYTILGLVIVEISSVIGIIGFYFIYLGNRG